MRTEEVLKRMAELLRIGGQERWACLLEAINEQLGTDPVQARYEIRRLYGGMGSLNDVVLVGDGKVLKEENDELDQLRSKLYSASH
jgi:hypothetical protein